MQNGKSYALFLQSGNVKGRFVTTGEAQGLMKFLPIRAIVLLRPVQVYKVIRFEGITDRMSKPFFENSSGYARAYVVDNISALCGQVSYVALSDPALQIRSFFTFYAT
jgi:hypothetical protein